ncbi:MFS transporter [Bacillus sp. FJAT-45066]|uniref:MFS transporter n=1 Tax=Bacillus sp. FJAT-45066 TaxID=2011010 RepID=UPI0015967681|nr:MFS transporter [Bacillus sp. FJAT-45066]
MFSSIRYYGSGILLVLMAILVACNIYTLLPLYTVISLQWNVTVSDVVIGSSFFTLFYAIGLLSFGALSERLGRKNILMFGILGAAFATALVGYSNNLTTLYFFRSLQGYLLGSFAPVAFAYCFDHYQERMRTIVISLINTGFLMSGMIGPLLSYTILTSWSWQGVYFSYSLFYLLIFVLCIVFLSPSAKHRNTNPLPFSSFYDLLKNRNLRRSYFVVFSLLLSFVAFFDSFYRHLHAHFTGDFLHVVHAIGLIGTFSSLLTSYFTKKLGINETMIVCIGLIILSFFMMFLIPSLWVFSIFSILFVASLSILIPSIISYIGLMAQSKRAIAISLYSFTLLTGASIGPIISDRFAFPALLVFFIAWYVVNIFALSRVEVYQEKKVNLNKKSMGHTL